MEVTDIICGWPLIKKPASTPDRIILPGYSFSLPVFIIGSIKCPKCQNVMTTDLPNQRYQCCGNFPYVVVDRMLTQFMEILTSVTSMWNMEVSSVIENLDDYLKRTETVLHSNHYLRLLAKRYLTQLLEDDCPRKKQLCQELLEMFSILDPGLSHR